MSVNRFASYFFVLCACATIAFGSSLMDHVAAAPDAVADDITPRHMDPIKLLHSHKIFLKHVQVALSE